MSGMLLIIFAANIHAQYVGIGTTTPLAPLHVANGSVLFSCDTGNVPISGAGTRLMWLPTKKAFRAGIVSSNEWDDTNVGFYSFAAGYSNIASGSNSVALGKFSKASGMFSFTMGENCNATANYSAAMNQLTTASGFGATSMGSLTTASGTWSLATGQYNSATGYTSVAMGYASGAMADYAIAMGQYVTANGPNSVALGTKVNINGHKGSFFFGDSDPFNQGTTPLGFDNEFVCRFAGGYYFLTSGGGNTGRTGMVANAGANSWSAISDKRLKENFRRVNGENFLHRISAIPLTTWNYKGQDPSTFRHYGPMAQDFYKAFGKDALGTIGCDTLINQQDFLGVSFIAIQALEKRTQKIELLLKQNEFLQKEVVALETKLANNNGVVQARYNENKNDQVMRQMMEAINNLKKENDALKKRVAKLEHQ